MDLGCGPVSSETGGGTCRIDLQGERTFLQAGLRQVEGLGGLMAAGWKILRQDIDRLAPLVPR